MVHRSDMTLHPARPRRMRLAPLMSWAALAITGGFLIAFLVQLGVFDNDDSPQAKREDRTPHHDRVVVSTSTITGFDKEKQPFTLESGSATQDPNDANIVHMREVKGALQRTSGEQFTMTANGAVYDTRAKSLKLEGNVEFVSRGQFVAKMPRASVTLSDKRLYTKARVVVTFGAGTITSNGLEVSEDGKNMLFFNRVKAVFDSASGKENNE